jgi:hypothetical protein
MGGECEGWVKRVGERRQNGFLEREAMGFSTEKDGE